MNLRCGRISVEVTNEDKVLWPGDGITKGELTTYYRAIGTLMLPHLRGRPLSMERWPDGIEGKSFWQKDAPGYFPGWMGRAELAKKNGVVVHPVCNNLASLVYIANQACVTPHTALSRADMQRRPDQIIFDLDPSGDDFGVVVDAARSLRALLQHVGLAAFVKTTGSRGLHVVAPLRRGEDFEEVHAFARSLARIAAARDPERLTIERSKAQRKGRLFLDYWRNAYAQTAVAPYAVRARPGAPVALPLFWEDLDDMRDGAASFRMRDVPALCESRDDPWASLRRRARSLAPAVRRLESYER